MIECVHVLGWQCVANKGEFQVGDKCVYMEVDSFLPVCDEFEFLRDTSFKQDEVLGAGFRLKTRKFRGQISQGLVQPLSILPDGEYQVGDDVTEILGIRKWEVGETVLTNGTVLHRFPGDIPKTNELRVQSYPELIDECYSHREDNTEIDDERIEYKIKISTSGSRYKNVVRLFDAEMRHFGEHYHLLKLICNPETMEIESIHDYADPLRSLGNSKNNKTGYLREEK